MPRGFAKTSDSPNLSTNFYFLSILFVNVTYLIGNNKNSRLLPKTETTVPSNEVPCIGWRNKLWTGKGQISWLDADTCAAHSARFSISCSKLVASSGILSIGTASFGNVRLGRPGLGRPKRTLPKEAIQSYIYYYIRDYVTQSIFYLYFIQDYVIKLCHQLDIIDPLCISNPTTFSDALKRLLCTH